MDNVPNVLVIGPGGIKGYQELGVLYYLETNGKLASIDTYICVSVGAIIGLLHNVGLSVKEIIYLAVENVDIIDLDLSNIDFINIISNFRSTFGLFSTQKIRDVITKAVIGKLGYIPSFKQLHDRTGSELIIVEFNLSKKVTQYYSYVNMPDMSCIDAVMLSINIPVIFDKARYQDAVYIDGAFGDPYPVLLKDNGQNNILGIYIETNMGDTNYQNILMYIHDILHCLFQVITERNIRESSSRCKHIGLKSDVMDTIGASVTIADKAKMVLDGIEAAKRHFEDRYSV